MMNSFRNFLKPPIVEDNGERTRRIQILHYASLFIFFFSLIIFLINVIFGSQNEKMITGLLGFVALVQLVVQWLIRSEHDVTAGHILIILGWGTVTMMARAFDGIQDVSILGYLAIILGAGYLIGRNAAIAFALASIAAIWWLANLQVRGFITPSLFKNPYRRALDLTANFALVFLVIYFLLSILTRALEKAQSELLERQKIEAKLKKSIALLSAEIDERKNAQVELRYQAITDFLTGLFNRRYFFEIAQKEFAKAVRYKRPLAIIIFDLDLFKDINDTYGHDIGDQALSHIGDLLRSTIRDIDISARYGGEEFIILLPEMNCINAEVAAERLRKTIQDTPVNVEEHQISMTISAGVASTDQLANLKSIDQLISNADKALYKAKRAGRNQVFCDNEKRAQ